MRRLELEEWREYFQDHGLGPDLIETYMQHLGELKRGVPPIFEFGHLAKLLGRTQAYLASVVNGSQSHYRVFKIPKRCGGDREIKAPYLALLGCQQWINRNVLSAASVLDSAHGFRHHRSILTNAHPHLDKSCLLKMDLRHFFPSISIARVIGVFRGLGYLPNVAFYLGRICTCEDSLPQGAATSPALSNLVARRLDARLMGISRSFSVVYTRYADDLTFSGANISLKTVEIITRIIKEEGFAVNEAKTRLCRGKGKRIVTGISVQGEFPQLPAAYKRRVRQEAYYVTKYGVASHVAKLRIRRAFYLDSLLGKLMFWKWVEPDNQFVNRILPQIESLRRA